MSKRDSSASWNLEAGLEAGFGRRAGSKEGSVLTSLARFLGREPKVLLRDEGPSASPPLRKTSADAKNALPRGRGNYQVLGELARGGMGVVLKGHDEDLGRDVALKVLHREFCERAESVQRFVEEAQIGGQLQHPGIVPVYELGLMADERPYFTMKLIKGRTLSSLLVERPDVGSERRRYLAIFEQVCQTMAYAHSRGVIHRDLKPSNVMVGAFGEVQVVDWGLAKVLAHGGTADERREEEGFSEVTVLETVRSGDGSSHSRAGSVMGTPAYMSPEQARGEVAKVDERADVFSLGAILCQLLTGKPPYVGDSRTTMDLAAAAELEDAHERLDSCGADAELLELAKHCLAPAPSARPQNAESVARAIHGHLARAEERAHRAEVKAAEERVKASAERRARRLTLMLAATILVATLIGGAGYLGYEARERERRDRLTGSIQAALDEATREQGRGRLASALSAVDQAASLAEQGEVDGELSTRLGDLRDSIESAIDELEAKKDLEARNAALFGALERASTLELHDYLREREATADPHSTHPTSSADGGEEYDQWRAREEVYGEAFWEYGLVFEPLDVEAVTRSILESGQASRIAIFLDDWARVRRRAGKSDSARQLSIVARRVDPDPWRARLRDALEVDDTAKLLELAGEADAELLPPLSAFLLGQALVLEERHEAAARLLQGSVRRHPDDFQVRYQLAHALRKKMPPRYEEALRQLEACLALRPDSVLALSESAYVLRHRHEASELEAAIDVARRAVEIAPDHAWARRQLGWSLWYADKREEALHEIEEAVLRSPDDPWARENLAWILWKTGRLQDAEDAARDLTRAHPEFARGHKTLADVLWALGREEASVPVYEKAAALESSYQNPLADSLRLTGQLERAIELYQRQIQQDPGKWDYYHDLVLAYEAAERPDLVMETLKRSAGVGNAEEKHFHRGLALMHLGRYVEAIAELELAIEYQPEQAETYSDLALCYAYLGRNEEAMEQARRAVELVPGEPRFLNNLAFVLTREGRAEEALQVVDRALRIPGIDSGVMSHLYVNRGNALLLLERGDESLQAFETALSYEPGENELLLNLGSAYHVKGDHERSSELKWEYLEEEENPKPETLVSFGSCLRRHAHDLDGSLELLERAVELDPDLAQAHHELGHTLQEMGLYAEAADAYREGLRLSPGNKHYMEMLIAVLPPDAPEVVTYYNDLVEASPDDAVELNSLAWTLARDPNVRFFDPERSVQLAERAVELEPEEPYFWNTYGLALLRTGRHQDAIAACRRSIELSGKDEYAEDWYVIAQGHHALDRIEDARSALERARVLHDEAGSQDPDLDRLAAEAEALFDD